MKLHSDSVIDKLEDKEKEVSKLEKKLKEYEQKLREVEEHWKLEQRAKDEENSALKRALENKIDQIIGLEKEIKELQINLAKQHKEQKEEETIQVMPSSKKQPINTNLWTGAKEYNSMALSKEQLS